LHGVAATPLALHCTSLPALHSTKCNAVQRSNDQQLLDRLRLLNNDQHCWTKCNASG
jgi:hypothetical protein